MTTPLNRRQFLQSTSLAAAATVGLAHTLGSTRPANADQPTPGHADRPSQLYKAVMWNMIEGDYSVADKFHMARDAGFEGIEMNSPSDLDLDEVRAACDETGLHIPSVVNSIHWQTRLSDPDPDIRADALEGLKTAIRDTHRMGASAVLLVPGRVADPDNENHDQVWNRSIEQVRQAIPLASRLGVHIAIENVWNGFLYDPEGPDDQTADQFAQYIDEYASPWVASYFDIGNHARYGTPADWARTLGHRIVKLHAKGWSDEHDFVDIGQGDIDWPGVRQALRDIGYSGWITAEVPGGGPDRLAEISGHMDQALDL